MSVRVFAPGRVNLIGDHTDYTGGLALPMAIQLGTTIEFQPGGNAIHLTSTHEPHPAELPISLTDPGAAAPDWAKYVAGVIAVTRPVEGGRGTVDSTLPVGAGLSSSASLELAVALALGFRGSALELALACQKAEQLASGVPCGVMDQLASASGVDGHALLLDCTSLEVTPVRLPQDTEIVAVHCGQPRRLAGSAYAERAQACQQAQSVIGPLREINDPSSLRALGDEALIRIARHVVTENERVRTFVAALRSEDLVAAGAAMNESHRSLAEDFRVSTPQLDALSARLRATPGVYGARLTGAGFGGCVVALAEPGVLKEGWVLEAVDGAHRQQE